MRLSLIPLARLPLALFTLFALAAPLAHGQTREDEKKLEAEHLAHQKAAEKAHAVAKAAAEEVERLRQQLIEIGAEQAKAERDLADHKSKLNDLNAEDRRLTAALGQERVRLGRLLSALQLASRNPPPPLLVSPRKATDAVRAAILMRALTPILAERAKVLADQSAALDKTRRAALIENETLIKLESAAADRMNRLEDLVRAKRKVEDGYMKTAAEADAEEQRLAEKLKTLRALLSGLEHQRTPETGPVRPWGGGLAAPVSTQVLRRFGEHAASGAKINGLIYAAPAGTVIRAPASGEIEFAGPLDDWGKVVIIKLGGGWRAVITGIDELYISKDRKAALGEPLGKTTESGPHQVYFELRKDDAAVDPAAHFSPAP